MATVSEWWSLCASANAGGREIIGAGRGDTAIHRTAANTTFNYGALANIDTTDDNPGVNTFSRALFKFKIPDSTSQGPARVGCGAL